MTGVIPQISAKYTCTDTDIPYGTTLIPIGSNGSGNTCTVAELMTTYQPTVQGVYNTKNIVTDPDGTTTTYTFNQVPPNNSVQYQSTLQSNIIDYPSVELSHTTTDSSGNVLEQVTNTYASDNIHLTGRSTSRLYGDNTGESWNYTTQPLGLLGGGTSSSNPYLVWTLKSLTTTNGSTVVKREDYTWNTPAFNAATPYFEELKTSDYLYDPAVGGYTAQTNTSYDQNTRTSSGVTLQHVVGSGPYGNVTSVQHYSSQDKAWIGTTHVYDDAGNVLQSTDARTNLTTYSYADEWANSNCLVSGAGVTGAYATRVTNALGQSASVVYNPCTGTKSSSTDANSKTTSYTYFPTTEQLEAVSYPDGGSSSFCYENTGSCSFATSSARNYTISSQLMTPDPAVIKEEDYDGVGRTVTTKALSDPWCSDEIDTLYNSREWVRSTTFPYCGTSVGASTAFLYNGLGYMTSRQVTGSAARTWSYSGQTETETDEVGNVTKRTLDSLARLAQVLEPNPTTNVPTYETDYTYEAGNNLVQVDQYGGPAPNVAERYGQFTYDTLFRLATSNNPEAGTITYSYDKNGNLTTQKDARAISATRSYDALNRLTQTLYSDGTPTECFAYDTPLWGGAVANGVGRLTGEWTQTGSCSSSAQQVTANVINYRIVGATYNGGYDAMGRLTSEYQCPTLVFCETGYPSVYTYNLGGHVSTEQHPGTPAGSVVLSHSYDGASRSAKLTSSWSDSMHPATLFEADASTNSSLGTPYGAFGLVNGQYGFGSSLFSYSSTTRGYDTHGRITSETDTGPSVPTAIPGSTATGSIGLSMNEQVIPTNSTPSTGYVTITAPYGSDQTSPGCNCSDTGFVEILVEGGSIGTTGYLVMDQSGSTTTSIATALAASVNGNSSSPVTATYYGPTVYLTSKAIGSGTNYSLDMENISTNGNFPNPSFIGTPNNPTMTGGATGSGKPPVYDAGTLSFKLGALSPLSLSWTSADTTSTLVSRLSSLINSTSAYSTVVRATPGTGQIALQAVAAGTAANLTMAVSTTNNSASFPTSSVLPSGSSAMSGGVNSIAAQAATVAYNFSSGVWDDTGNLKSISDSVFGPQTFGYDHLNRLKVDTITSTKGTGALNWAYDPYGNRLSQSATGTLPIAVTQTSNTYTNASYQNSVLINSTSYPNRADGMNYDLSGNLLNNGTMTFTYDAASRIKTAGTTCYVYNAEGIRTAKGTWVSGICGNITNQYLLGQGSEQVAEFSGIPTGTSNPVSWLHSNVYDGGHLVATYDPNGLHFHFTDWLGTNRVQMNANSTIEETCLSMPFGDSLSCSGTGTDATEHHFTGKEHDNESGLDYFGARYYGSNMGRWMSPDWAAKAEPIPYAKMDDPQSLNLYEYVGNNPLTKADADGHDGPDCGCPQIPNLETTVHNIQSATGRFENEVTEDFLIVRVFVAATITLAVDASKGAVSPVAAPAAPSADGNSKPLVGNNPKKTNNRTNTDLPGGHKAAEKLFGEETAGQEVKTDPVTGHKYTKDNKRLRLNPDGKARVNLPNRGTQPNGETVHFNDPDVKAKEAHPNVKDHDFPRESPVISNQD